MKIKRFVSGMGAVFIAALMFMLAACRYLAENGVTVTIPEGGGACGDIYRAISEAVTRSGGGSAPEEPLNLIIKGMDFEDASGMLRLFNALQKYYVNLTFWPGSGTAFKALPFPNTPDKSRILSIALHGEVMEIGPGAFRGWTGLKTINLPAVISVGDGAFQNCTGLEIISLPAASFVGDGAFQNCTGLEMISLPAASFVGDSAFSGCTNLARVELQAVQFLGRQVFSNTGSRAIELVFTQPYPPKFVDAAGINLFGGSLGKRVMVNAPAYFGSYEDWGKKNGTDTEKAAIWGDGITVIYASQ